MRLEPKWLWLSGGVLLLVALSRRARARSPIGSPASRGGIVSGGRQPRGSQVYLYERTPTHLHRGVDIGAPRGSAVFAAGPGRVAAAWPDGRVSGYGNTVVLQHPDGTQTLYAHMDRFAPGIATGVTVARGQHIGDVGVTQLPRPPMVSAPHLHFEAHRRHTLAIREDNPERFEPLAYLQARNMGVTA